MAALIPAVVHNPDIARISLCDGRTAPISLIVGHSHSVRPAARLLGVGHALIPPKALTHEPDRA